MGEDLSKGPIIYLFDGRWLSFLAGEGGGHVRIKSQVA